jgi:hypothetical protein
MAPKRSIRVVADLSESAGPFHYSLPLEYALNEFYGHDGKWHNMAGSFAHARNVRRAVLDATKAIRKRLAAILTADDRLRLLVDVKLSSIESRAAKLDDSGAALLDLLAGFIHLSAALLGYDWLKGAPNREVVYFQTQEQQFRDDAHRHASTAYPPGKIEYEHRGAIAKDLYSKGLRVAQIARTLNQPETVIKDILVREGVLRRRDNVKETS